MKKCFPVSNNFLFAIILSLLIACNPNDDNITPEPIPTIDTSTVVIDTTLKHVDTLPNQDTIKPVVIENVAILTYHKVVSVDSLAIYSTQVSVSKLEADFKWLADNGYTAILPRELLTIDTIKSKTVIITFDDGYYNNYLYMYPLLEKYGLKAEINVIVDWITDERTNSWLTWNECKEMSESGLVEIGSHTCNLHNPTNGGSYILGGVNGVGREVDESNTDYIERITADLQKSKDVIKERVGIEPVSFAYPYGEGNSFINSYISDLFAITFLTYNGNFNPKGDLHLLPRNGVTMETSLESILE
jgi:peptidoglycan/xylan/chitin deacetylase (PgdA/CDA1 family)